VPFRGGDLAAVIEEHQDAHPFVVRQVRLARVVVQVVDEGFQQELQAASVLRLEALLHGFGDRILVDVAHRALPSMAAACKLAVDEKLNRAISYGKRNYFRYAQTWLPGG
jgi:hypothetical protein